VSARSVVLIWSQRGRFLHDIGDTVAGIHTSRVAFSYRCSSIFGKWAVNSFNIASCSIF